MSDLKDDISYMRRLAERGRNGPVLGGAFLAAAGLVFGLSCGVHWAGVTGLLPLRPGQFLYLWIGAFALFAVLWVVLFMRLRARAVVASSASSSAFGIAWAASGAGIVVACVAVEIVAAVTNAPAVRALYVPTAFAFYGVAWWIAGVLARRSWMYAAAAASFLVTLLLAAMTGDPRQLLVMGAALLLLLSVPGLRLMYEESRR